MSDKDVRVYGNQHGTWIEVTGQTRIRWQAAADALGVTLEQFILDSIEWKARQVLGDERVEEIRAGVKS